MDSAGASMKLVVKSTFLEVVDADPMSPHWDGCASAPPSLLWSRAVGASRPRPRPLRNEPIEEGGFVEPDPALPASCPAATGFPANDGLQICTEESLQVGQSSTPEKARTTIVLRNLPNDYTRNQLMALLDNASFHKQYDFIYLPVEVGARRNFSYAFVNFVKPEYARRFLQWFQTFKEWDFSSKKPATVDWSHAQGLAEHICRYRNNPVMHTEVPDECKPVILKNGVRVEFPRPTKKIPNLRRLRTRKGWRPNKLAVKAAPQQEWAPGMLMQPQAQWAYESKQMQPSEGMRAPPGVQKPAAQWGYQEQGKCTHAGSYTMPTAMVYHPGSERSTEWGSEDSQSTPSQTSTSDSADLSPCQSTNVMQWARLAPPQILSLADTLQKASSSCPNSGFA